MGGCGKKQAGESHAVRLWLLELATLDEYHGHKVQK
jgi:hypothetical protein